MWTNIYFLLYRGLVHHHYRILISHWKIIFRNTLFLSEKKYLKNLPWKERVGHYSLDPSDWNPKLLLFKKYLTFNLDLFTITKFVFNLCEETISRTDEGQPRPKYIINKCGTNIYFFTLQRFGPSPSLNFNNITIINFQENVKKKL